MDIEESIANICKNTAEVIEIDELKEILKKDEKIAYVGFEPSGKIHLGHALTIKRMKALQDAGFKIKIFIADLHAYLNGKGTLEEIQETAKYNTECFKALGLSEDTEFILGSSRMRAEYMFKVFQVAQTVTIQRAQRSMAQISRDETHNVAEAMYPIMQALDIEDLDIESDLIENNSFLSSARWVAEQYTRITTDNPIGSILKFSLVLGFVMIFLGRFK
jgi:tyrosyl-tRNA synthetase